MDENNFKCTKCGCEKYLVAENDKQKVLICDNEECCECYVIEQKVPVESYINSYSSTPTATCPYCQSTNTKKITNTSKAVHTAMFGIFSMSRNTKQWHCNNCKSDF